MAVCNGDWARDEAARSVFSRIFVGITRGRAKSYEHKKPWLSTCRLILHHPVLCVRPSLWVRGRYGSDEAPSKSPGALFFAIPNSAAEGVCGVE